MGVFKMTELVNNLRVTDKIINQGTFGNVYYVVKSSESYYTAFKKMFDKKYSDNTEAVHGTLLSAYTACTSGRNDVILLDGNATHALADGIAWTKNRINVIGMDGGERLVQQGAKVELSGAVATAYVLKVTGTRNTFKNIKFIQSSTNAAALNVIQSAGEGVRYENCSHLFGVSNNLSSASAIELLCGEDSGTWVNCSFGTDVLLKSAASSEILLNAVAGGNADGAKSNRFVNCETVVMSSEANHVAIKLASAAGAKFLNRFINQSCIAVKNQTNAAIVNTNAVASAAGFVEGSLVFEGLTTANYTNGCAGVADNVIVSSPVSSSNAYEGVTPA